MASSLGRLKADAQVPVSWCADRRMELLGIRPALTCETLHDRRSLYSTEAFGMPTWNVRHKSSKALMLIDVVNHFEFPDGKRILRNALPLAPRLARLKARARRANIPVIYVNDSFGQWRSDAAKLLAYCLRTHSAGGGRSLRSSSPIPRIIAFSSPCTRPFTRLHLNFCFVMSEPARSLSRDLQRTAVSSAPHTKRT